MIKAILFNGSIDSRAHAIGNTLTNYFSEKLQEQTIEVDVFNMGKAAIPLLDTQQIKNPPRNVLEMCRRFQEADIHFWLAPLYHGSIPGAMKNCLDWLEVTAQTEQPYLTDRTIGMVCWADGSQAVHGINTMNNIAHALRAWTLPYTVPISTQFLLESNKTEIVSFYKNKLDRLLKLGISRRIDTW